MATDKQKDTNEAVIVLVTSAMGELGGIKTSLVDLRTGQLETATAIGKINLALFGDEKLGIDGAIPSLKDTRSRMWSLQRMVLIGTGGLAVLGAWWSIDLKDRFFGGDRDSIKALTVEVQALKKAVYTVKATP